MTRSRSWFGAVAGAALVLCLLPTGASAVSTTVVISQIYGAGGNVGAIYKNDYIELHNLSSSAVDISGWAVQYDSATDNGASWQVTAINSGSIAAHAYYLVQEAAGGSGNGVSLPAADATGSLAMGATAGKVALTSTQVACTGGCVLGANTVDYVGYGSTANTYEGAGPAPDTSSTLADFRKDAGETDTDQNGADFSVNAPLPRNHASPPVDTTGPVTTTNALPMYEKATSFTVSWAATDTNGVASYESQSRFATPSAGFTSVSAWYDGTDTNSVYSAAAGQTVCISTMATDTLANPGAFSAERCTAIPIDDVSLTATKFTRKTNPGYFAGTFSLSVATGAKLTSATISAKRLALLATTCPSCGSVQVKWKGAIVGTFSLFSATTKHKVLIPITVFAALQSGIAQIVTLSTARVEIDGLYASRK